MLLEYYLGRVADIIAQRNNSVFKLSRETQEKYLSSFREPLDDIERSFFQYKCQMKLMGRMIKFIVNILSFPLAVYYYISLSNNKNTVCSTQIVDAVFLSDGKPITILPAEACEEYSVIEVNAKQDRILFEDDKRLIMHLVRRYPFSWHFILKDILRIAQYRGIIERYKPKAMIVCNEYSFCSSLLTMYCNTFGIWHINVMHGEKLYYIRDSFFRFDKCYVWDKYYSELFQELRAEKNQFIVSVPQALKFKVLNRINKTIDYTYYLSDEKREVLKRIYENLNILVQAGFIVAIRPHPRYSDMKTVRELFRGIEIEVDIDIETSILRTRNVIALYSTVLNQAFANNVDIVIDDISMPEKYLSLKKVRYRMLYIDHKLLSKIIERN